MACCAALTEATEATLATLAALTALAEETEATDLELERGEGGGGVGQLKCSYGTASGAEFVQLRAYPPPYLSCHCQRQLSLSR